MTAELWTAVEAHLGRLQLKAL